MSRARRITLSALVAMFAAAPTQAQWGATFDAGYSHLHQAGLTESNAVTFGGTLSHLGDRTSFQSVALASRTSGSRWTVQGITGASWASPPVRRARLELTGSLSTFAATNALPTLSSELMARARLGNAEQGAALGVGGGTFSQETRTSPLMHVQANAWRAVWRDQFTGDASFVRTHSVHYSAAVAAGYAIPLALRQLSYADVSAGWRREYAAVSFGAVGGLRAGIAGIERTGAWAAADAMAWFTPRAAVVAGAGRTLEDVVRGAPRTRYVSLSIRLSAQAHPSISTRRAVSSGPEIAIQPAADGQRRITARALNATHVEIRSDFTNWNPLALERTGNEWTANRMLAPGLHRILMRIDGGEWIVPANLPHATDDLGGVVGLITVP